MILTGITYGIVCACIVIAIVAYFYYRARINAFRKQLTDGFEIAEDMPLFSILKDYNDTFNPEKKTSEYASDFFTLDSIANAYKIRLKFFSSIPNLLTSLGILGTFIGLSFALSRFNSDTSDAIRESINTLMDGMGSAFLTSVAGMACAALFLLLERLLLNRAEADIDAFCARLDRKHHISADQVLLSAFMHKDEDEFEITPGEAFAKMANNLKSMKTTIDQFGTDLTDSIGNAMDKSFEDKLVPIIDNLAKKLENPAQALTDSLVKELKEVCNTLEENLTKGINEQMNELLGRFITASDAINNIPTAVQEVNELIKNSSSDTIKASMEVSKALDEQILRLADLSDAFAANIEKANTSAGKLNELNEALVTIPATVQAASEAINAASTNLDESNIAFGSSLEALRQSNDATTESVQQYVQDITTIQEGLKSIFGQVQEGLTRYADATRNGIQEMLDPFTTSLTDATTKVSNSIVPLNDAVSDLNGFGNLVKNSLKELSDALTPLEQSIQQLYDVRNKIVADVAKEAKKLNQEIEADR